MASYPELGPFVSTDLDSLESGDFHRVEISEGKANNSTIGKK